VELPDRPILLGIEESIMKEMASHTVVITPKYKMIGMNSPQGPRVCLEGVSTPSFNILKAFLFNFVVPDLLKLR
jgi:hypothetical protein